MTQTGTTLHELPDNAHMCGARAHGLSYTPYDTWETNRWSEEQCETNKFPCAIRTCSYCGGVHDDDLITLMDAGWTVEKATGKSYKLYVHPPGYLETIQYMMDNPGELPPEDIPRLEGPPVKWYVYHANQDFINNLNERIQAQRRQAEG